MLRNFSVGYIFLINLCFMLVWHISCFVACVCINKSYFNPERKRYQSMKWERNGKWYDDKLKIKKWKDKLPQHVGKDGFSKEHFTNHSIKYIDEFIFETCRAEWNHCMSCFFAVISLLINNVWIGLIFSCLTLIANLPFIAIQRYNRIRLQILKKHLENRGKLGKRESI